MSDHWKIYIGGYGTFDFQGVEYQAEARMIDKKRHEGGLSAFKWRADESTELDKLTAKVASHFASGKGCPGALFDKRARLLKKLRAEARSLTTRKDT